MQIRQLFLKYDEIVSLEDTTFKSMHTMHLHSKVVQFSLSSIPIFDAKTLKIQEYDNLGSWYQR